ncbi:hypothetical protein KYC_03584 [Achromobacter arsenitoxydans SY8]|uniref:Uncharacterized protein n=1 Tax=Achromobacter arsenitoxydans SY8 TaxID=477184 RepID=H0F1T2_9BURK|nr:hypothetical protein KYC_03584 [Achromobacter arsenitoxydans SY8]
MNIGGTCGRQASRDQALLFEDQKDKAIAGINATAGEEQLLERWRAAEIPRLPAPPARAKVLPDQ